ncbi:MAG: MepB family protein [Bacteroidota bacterium]
MNQENKNLDSAPHGWEVSPENGTIPFQLSDFIENFVAPMQLEITSGPTRNSENSEYGGTALSITGKKILFRVAKTTPTKAGQFVALYKRSKSSGKIIPIDVDDTIDFVFIATFNQDYHGVFIFYKEILIKKGIYSKEEKSGKLSFRVYAPWVNTIAPLAKKTQTWQCNYFMHLDRKPDETFKQFEKLFI